ncbi:MAG TPA: aldo/keto reductase [Gemmatimonadales bacterium]|nr:aldo/keto reductase [Gemmatimonadales bacterium]
MPDYIPADNRYAQIPYRRSGRSGLDLPAVSLGLWQNFGTVDASSEARAMLRRAFDLGITHFDLANNYGPPPGSAEETFGRVLAEDLRPWRDELIVSTKAGYVMWPGPYGNWGSRKYLIASLDQSLKRMGLDYVDIFYHHRPDPNTPLEETMGALDYAVKSGRALYVGISRYSPDDMRRAVDLLARMGTRCLIHQPKYSMFVRKEVEGGLLATLRDVGLGCIVFSPLAQGLLTDKYLKGVPEGSRATKPSSELGPDEITRDVRDTVRRLNDIAQARGQTLAQMAITWVLRHPEITSALIGASRVSHVEEAVAAASATPLSAEELKAIEEILGS